MEVVRLRPDCSKQAKSPGKPGLFALQALSNMLNLVMVEQERLRKPLAELARQWADVENLVTRTDRPLARLEQYDDAMDMGASLRTAPFLAWIADRLVQVHGESENVDFVRSLRERTEALDIARNNNNGQM